MGEWRKRLANRLRLWSRDVSGQIARDLAEWAPTVSGTLLDLGCGDKPYAHLFENVTACVGVDLPDSRSASKMPKRPDLFADLAALPFRDAGFDSVLSTQALEHVAEPAAVLMEAARVLRDDGIILLTIPFLAAEHEEPHDYFRFTSYGIVSLLKRSGFTDIRVKKQFGFWSAIGEMVYWHFHRKVCGSRWEKFWFAVGTTLFLRAFHLLNRLDSDDKLVLNLLATARRLPRACADQPELTEPAVAGVHP